MKDLKFEKDDAQFIISILQDVSESDSLNKGDHARSLRLMKKVQNAMKTITISSRKGKGREFQYRVCNMIADLLGIPYVQADDECLIHSREMGQHHEDIILRGTARRDFPFSIECKAQESLDMVNWIRQAQCNVSAGTDWMLVFKKQTLGTQPYVCLDFATFLKYYKKPT